MGVGAIPAWPQRQPHEGHQQHATYCTALRNSLQAARHCSAMLSPCCTSPPPSVHRCLLWPA
eukprot:489040-Prorocentrum_lima.AAC.1